MAGHAACHAVEHISRSVSRHHSHFGKWHVSLPRLIEEIMFFFSLLRHVLVVIQWKKPWEIPDDTYGPALNIVMKLTPILILCACHPSPSPPELVGTK